MVTTTDKIAEQTTTPVVRCQYVYLNPAKPRVSKDNDSETWSIDLLFDPKDASTQDFAEWLKGVREAYQAKYKKPPAKGGKLVKLTEFARESDSHLPDGRRKKTPAELVGFYKLNAKTYARDKDGELKPPVQLFGRQKEPIEFSKIYAGCYVRALISVVSYDRNGGGLGVYLNGVQFIRDGQPLGGNFDASSAFDIIEDDDDDDLI